MKILLAPNGSHGDVRPQVALAQGLKKAGHEVHFLSYVNFQEFIESHGFSFSPVGIDFKVLLATLVQEKQSTKEKLELFKEVYGAWFAAMKEHAAHCDMLITSGVPSLGTVFRDYYKILHYHALHTPIILPSSTYPVAKIPYQNLPGFLNRLLWKMRKSLMGKIFMPHINGYRNFLELEPITYDEVNGTMIVSADKELFPVPSDVTHPYIQTSYWHLHEKGGLDPALEEFIAKGEKNVYIGFGSMVLKDRDKKAFHRAIEDIIKNTDLQIVLSKGWGDLVTDVKTDRIYSIEHIRHDLLFPKMDAVVHHGGTGTTSTALIAGIPQIISPHLGDQFYNAERLRRAGIGWKAIKLSKLDKGLTRALREITGNPAYMEKARAMGELLKNKKDGVEEFIEKAGL